MRYLIKYLRASHGIVECSERSICRISVETCRSDSLNSYCHMHEKLHSTSASTKIKQKQNNEIKQTLPLCSSPKDQTSFFPGWWHGRSTGQITTSSTLVSSRRPQTSFLLRSKRTRVRSSSFLCTSFFHVLRFFCSSKL